MLNYSVLFLTNYPSPYRVDFFNQLGKSIDLTVIFTSGIKEQKHRDPAWFNENYTSFRAVFLKNSISIGNKRVFWDVIDYLKQNWDMIISGGYSSPTQMLAFEWMRMHHIPFYMELDGGFVKRENKILYCVKKHFLSSPLKWFSPSRITDEYLTYYGATADRIIRYSFTSLWDKDIKEARNCTPLDKKLIKCELSISETKVVLAVGQFIHRKGFDLIIKAASKLQDDIGVYIVGGNPTEEYILLKEQVGAQNVHFLGFKTKEQLKKYYMAADVFVMPTREDIWGLVINEALSFGLPVVSTDRCGAALELIENGKNGFVVPAEDVMAIVDAILKVFRSNYEQLSSNALSSIRNYSIENMVKVHINEIQQSKG